MEYLHNNSIQQLETQDDIDCCFMAILSWGKSLGAHIVREMWRKSPPENLPPLTDPSKAPMDFHIRQSARTLYMKNADFWLRPKDTDWHLPILVTLRDATRKNWRSKSLRAENNREVKKKRHWDKMSEQMLRAQNKKMMKSALCKAEPKSNRFWQRGQSSSSSWQPGQSSSSSWQHWQPNPDEWQQSQWQQSLWQWQQSQWQPSQWYY